MDDAGGKTPARAGAVRRPPGAWTRRSFRTVEALRRALPARPITDNEPGPGERRCVRSPAPVPRGLLAAQEAA